MRRHGSLESFHIPHDFGVTNLPPASQRSAAGRTQKGQDLEEAVVGFSFSKVL